MKKDKIILWTSIIFIQLFSEVSFWIVCWMIASKLKSDFGNSAAKLANDKYLFRPTLELVFNFQVVKELDNFTIRV